MNNAKVADLEGRNPTASMAVSQPSRVGPRRGSRNGGLLPTRSKSRSHRSVRSNNPYYPPAEIKPNSTAWRRWWDVATDYGERLGDRLLNPATSSVFYNLLWTTFQLERLRAEPGVNPYTVQNLARSQERLLRALGLLPADGAAQPTSIRNIAREYAETER